MSKKLTNCKVCGAKIAKGATCPHCGAKNKKGCLPSVLIALAIIAIIGMIGGGGSEDEPVKNAETETTDVETELTDAEMERIQAIFREYVGEELQYKPKYAGEWRNGDQYVTENFAYGQYLINMDVKGNVHLVVWVQDKKGEEGRFVVYNRLEDENAVTETPNDGAIHLIDGQKGEYGTTAESGFIHYKVPAGDYTVVNEAKRAVVFVVGDDDPNDERYYIPLQEGESAEITVDEDAHIELSAASMVALKAKK